ncbi:methionyl-tRNA formyltransferase [Alteromonas oceanisediminis]|uniref:methionyl-tRNA formyltransferase n=1 Tax=Alteromonas oceanisediminis TaxID=2836180 RepID=UPI001BDB062E|nr:methionyl-tRNA formyltransferase [Alteromonas oceanisediminis]MBT0586655.1 methionyl-tRNA formyltransferase [Alteromonas oceanisediminis]
MRIIFAGTPDFAATHLTALLNTEHQIVAVYTQPDRPAGRGKQLQASPVKRVAAAHNLPVLQPESLRSEEAAALLRNFNADVMVVVAYGIILPRSILTALPKGCLNVHGSLLPKWRGAAPIQRSLWAGDTVTGVTIMQMDEGLDTGAMLYKQEVAIAAHDTSASLYTKLAEVGPTALIHTLAQLDAIQPQSQDDAQASYAKKLSKPEAELDWQQSAAQLERNVRAFNPWPVAWFTHNETVIKVWKSSIIDTVSPGSAQAGSIVHADKEGICVMTGNGVLRLEQLQFPGKKPAHAAQVLNGRADWFTTGTLLK